jgi:hypothetical protein
VGFPGTKIEVKIVLAIAIRRLDLPDHRERNPQG